MPNPSSEPASELSPPNSTPRHVAKRRTPVLVRLQRGPASDTRKLLTVLGGLGLALGFVGVAAHYVPSTRPVVLGIAALAPVLMSGAVFGLVLLALAHRWYGVAASALVLAFALIAQSSLYVSSTPPANGRDLVVMTANLGLGQAEPRDVVNAVRRHHVEILMVQELTSAEVDRLTAAGLDDALGYQALAPGGGPSGSGVWSRYPLTGGHQVTGFTFAAVAARVTVPGVPRQPTVLTVHMSGPVPDAADWSRDIARLPATLFDQPTDAPVLVGGDFNAGTDTPQYRAALVAGFRDAADQAGSGYPRTWPANRGYPPLLAIDHVVTRGAVGMSTDTIKIRGSDHRALLTKVRIPV